MSDPTEEGTKKALLSSLNNQRSHVLGILDGLSDEALRRPLLPTGWNCLGLVQHLALDVERLWFRVVFAGEAVDDPFTGVENAWLVEPDLTADTVFDLYRGEIERANAVIEASGLDAAPSNWPEGLFGEWRLADLRAMMLHVITETACHAGHLDAARELVDGTTWLVLTD